MRVGVRVRYLYFYFYFYLSVCLSISISPPHVEIEDRHCDFLLETDKDDPVVLRVMIGTN